MAEADDSPPGGIIPAWPANLISSSGSARNRNLRSWCRCRRGDDLAVVSWPEDDLLLVGVDQVLDGVHFDSRIHAPRLIGKKVMNRNLSDCAAMACLPVAAVATVALPRAGVGSASRTIGGIGPQCGAYALLDYAKELYLGMKDAADRFYCKIIGGDTGSWEGKLAMTVTILGRSAGIKPVRRSGAKAGDGIYISGALGGSLLGRHLDFEPRIHLSRQLAKAGHITSMIDISDGLSRDLSHICRQSWVGAVIEAERIPIHPDAILMSQRDGRSPLEHALHDGEDHELLFTAGALAQAGIRIGTITAEPEILLEIKGQRLALEAKGWEHSM